MCKVILRSGKKLASCCPRVAFATPCHPTAMGLLPISFLQCGIEDMRRASWWVILWNRIEKVLEIPHQIQHTSLTLDKVQKLILERPGRGLPPSPLVMPPLLFSCANGCFESHLGYSLMLAHSTHPAVFAALSVSIGELNVLTKGLAA